MNEQPTREGFIEDTAAIGAPEPEIETKAPPPPVEMWPVRVRLLHRSIRNNQGVEVHELVLRQPTGGDINRYGNPVRVNQEGDIVIDEQKMHRIMAALSGILPPLIEQLDTRDWNSVAYRLRSFFLPDVAAW